MESKNDDRRLSNLGGDLSKLQKPEGITGAQGEGDEPQTPNPNSSTFKNRMSKGKAPGGLSDSDEE